MGGSWPGGDARDLPKPPVYVLGTGEAIEHNMVSAMHDMTTSEAAKVSGRAAFEMSGVKHSEIDVAELYDAFAFTPALDVDRVDPVFERRLDLAHGLANSGEHDHPSGNSRLPSPEELTEARDVGATSHGMKPP